MQRLATRRPSACASRAVAHRPGPARASFKPCRPTGSAAELGLDAAACTALARYLARKQLAAEAAAARCLGLRCTPRRPRDPHPRRDGPALRAAPGATARINRRSRRSSPSSRSAGADIRWVDTGHAQTAAFDIAVPADAELSCPYWLVLPTTDYAYAWPDDVAVGEPFDPPPIPSAARCRSAVARCGCRRPRSARRCSPAATGSWRRRSCRRSRRPRWTASSCASATCRSDSSMRVGVLGHRKGVFPTRGGARSLRAGRVDGAARIAHLVACARTATRTRSR